MEVSFEQTPGKDMLVLSLLGIGAKLLSVWALALNVEGGPRCVEMVLKRTFPGLPDSIGKMVKKRGWGGWFRKDFVSIIYLLFSFRKWCKSNILRAASLRKLCQGLVENVL